MSDGYVHGYSQKESFRLGDQANTLENLIHHDTVFPEGSLVLEAGCGVGAQTRIISTKNPGSRFISMDISETSVKAAETLIKNLKITNVEFQNGNIMDMKFKDEYFDSIIVCFVLEHLKEPAEALISLKRVLKKGGRIILIEGDHGSAYFYPDSGFAQKAINSQVTLQSMSGGNALIGRELYPLLKKTGFKNISVSPRMVYADPTRPEMADGFTKKTFTAMIEGVRKEALEKNVIDEITFDRGIKDLYRTADKDGVFCYTFFKGTGIK